MGLFDPEPGVMFCVCPDCNKLFHMRPAHGFTPQTWIAQHAPETKPGEKPRAQCFECWKAAKGRAQATWDRLVEEHRLLAVKEVLGTITPEETARLADVRAGIDAAEEILNPPDVPQTPAPTSTTIAK